MAWLLYHLSCVLRGGSINPTFGKKIGEEVLRERELGMTFLIQKKPLWPKAFFTQSCPQCLPLNRSQLLAILREMKEGRNKGKAVKKLSDQIRSVAQSCPTLCDPMNRSMPGLPVHHQLPEFTQTHVHRVSDAIQPSHPLLSPSPPAPKPSQHQSLFQ